MQNYKIGISNAAARGIVEWTKSENSLRNLLDGGLNELFRDVFGDDPYNEVFSKDEVDQIFRNYLQNNADILSIREDLNGRPIAFMVGMPLSNEFKKACGLPDFLFTQKTAYIAEDGVDKNWRRRGLSCVMKCKMLSKAKSDGCNFALLRTRADNTPQISAVFKAGGSVIDGAQQMVSRNTRVGVIQEDNRFFLFDLRRQFGSYII
jgi:hypothetical protein